MSLKKYERINYSFCVNLSLCVIKYVRCVDIQIVIISSSIFLFEFHFDEKTRKRKNYEIHQLFDIIFASAKYDLENEFIFIFISSLIYKKITLFKFEDCDLRSLLNDRIKKLKFVLK